MEFLDARRLTGPSLLFDVPGTILDVQCTGEEAERLIPVWGNVVRRMLAELDWENCEFEVGDIRDMRFNPGYFSKAFSRMVFHGLINSVEDAAREIHRVHPRRSVQNQDASFLGYGIEIFFPSRASRFTRSDSVVPKRVPRAIEDSDHGR